MELSSTPEESKPTSDHPNNHHRFLPPPPVVETCKDWEFGGFVHGKGMGSDSFGDLCGSQVDKVEAVISEFVTKGEESLGNLEKGFVEDDALRCRESEISPPELRKKKMLLRDLECGCVSGEVVGDVSEGTSVLGNFCHLDGMNKVVRELWARNSGKMKDGNGKMKVADGGNEGFDLRRSLKIAVIDDTAVVDQVPNREFRGMVKKEIGAQSGPKNQNEIVDGEKGLDGKKTRQAWRKAKSLHGSEEMLGKQENANARSQNMAGRKLMYSIKEMEALRFVNVIEQRRFWRRVYDGLGPVAKEYVSLLSCYDKNYQHTHPGSNFDCIQQSLRREQPPVILGAMAGSGRRNHHSNIFVPPNMMKTLYSTNWSYSYVS